MSNPVTLEQLKKALDILNPIPRFLASCFMYSSLIGLGACMQIYHGPDYSLADWVLTVLVFTSAIALLRFMSCTGGRYSFLKLVGKPAFNYGEGVIFERATEYVNPGILYAHDFVSDDDTFLGLSCMCYIHRPRFGGGYRRSKKPEKVLFCHFLYQPLVKFKKSFVIGTTCRMVRDSSGGICYVMCSDELLTPSDKLG
jgi:hypothetical protein